MGQLIKYTVNFLKWTVLALVVGCLGGLLGAAFHYTLHFVTHIRMEHGFLIYLLPLGGLLSVGLYKLCKLSDNRGINDVIDCLIQKKPIHPLLAPVLFIASAITHLFGASGGREGAIFQIGGSAASVVARGLRLDPEQRTVLIMCGMSAAFSGLFGTPLTAALFALEFAAVGTIFAPAVFPCYLASCVGVFISSLLGVSPETAQIGQLGFGAGALGQVAVLAVCVSALGIGVCEFFHWFAGMAGKKIPDQRLRILGLSVIIVLATLAVGDQRYSGTGMEMALKAVGGEAAPYDFLLKMVFTALTLAAGFKGGEIVPVFCIGATFGCVAGGVLGMDPGICAALGLVGLFCCVTNAPLTSIVLGIEMFGAENLYAFALVSIICFALSGHSGLYTSQLHQFHKVNITVYRKTGHHNEDGG